MRALALCAALGACGFTARTGGTSDATSIDGPPQPQSWWDPAYGARRRLVVTTGPTRPDKGYAGYTVFAALDPTTLGGLATDCRDLRVVTYDGEAWAEIGRHVIGCGSTRLDLRFAVPVDLPDAMPWYGAYIYYGASSVGAPPTTYFSFN